MNNTTMTTGNGTWTVQSIGASGWAICNVATGERYTNAQGHWLGWQKRASAEGAMRRIAKRWGYTLS